MDVSIKLNQRSSGVRYMNSKHMYICIRTSTAAPNKAALLNVRGSRLVHPADEVDQVPVAVLRLVSAIAFCELSQPVSQGLWRIYVLSIRQREI